MKSIVLRVHHPERENVTVALLKALFPECEVTLLPCVEKLPSPQKERGVDRS
jgi:hypothetical protein